MFSQKITPFPFNISPWKKFILEDDPQAPVHVLVIPKKHIESLDDVKEEDKELLGYIMFKIHEIAADLGLENGYRVVSNNGEDAFQTVKHLHFHILGKRKMTWPPG